jgi:hypothetical protein
MRSLLAAVLLAFLPIAALAQPPSPPPDAIEIPGLARINASLREILALLEKQSEAQATDLLMKRVQLAEARLADSNNRLRAATLERRSLEATKTSLEGRIELLAARMAQAPTEGSPEIEAMSRQAIVEQRRIQQRLAALADEASKVESEISSQSADLVSWQDTLDRALAKP